MRAAILLGLLAACGKADKPPGPCDRGGTIEVRLVDHDAPYMRAAYAKVGAEGRDSAPTDPEAIAAGVRAEIDQWQQDTSTRDDELPREKAPLQTDYYLMADSREALAGYLAKLPPVPDDREVRIQHIAPPRDSRDPRAYFRTYYVAKRPILDTTQVADVRLRDNHLWVVLTDDGKTAFAAATAEASKLGHKLATLVDGSVLSAPIINGAITGGKLTITTPDPAALAKQLACVTAPAR